MTVEDEWLVVFRKGARADLHLGSVAEKWKHAILNPKSIMDKIGLKPDHCYQIWGEFEPEFVQDAHSRAGKASKDGPFDVVFVHLRGESDLPRMVEARAEIKRDGMIWAVWAKGQKAFNDSHIRAYCLANGLVDVKIASVSNVLTSCKYVIPVRDR